MIIIVATPQEAQLASYQHPEATIILSARPPADLLTRLLTEHVGVHHHVSVTSADELQSFFRPAASSSAPSNDPHRLDAIKIPGEEMKLPDEVAERLRRMVGGARPPSPPPPLAMRRQTWRHELRAMFFLTPRKAR